MLPLNSKLSAFNFISVLLLLSLSAHAQDSWQLVWSDEFEGEGRPDEASWNFETGFVRNHEDQWYQPDNAFQKDGVLIIEARKEHRDNPTYQPGSSNWGRARQYIEYTSSCITTARKHTFLYGRLEVRAKIPVASGSWPAIWTLGTSMQWPSCGEVDVMEFYRINGVPHILANAAWGGDQRWNAVWNSKRIPYSHFIGRDAQWADKFHVWRMDWDELAIKLYLDDELLNTIDLTKTINGRLGQGANPFHQPHYILLNLALGGDNGGTIDDSAFPMRYEIDYVRIYQKK